MNTTTNQTAALQERFNEKWIPEPFSSCHLWFGAHDRNGYGRISVGGRSGKVWVSHRIAWELHRGKIPKGLDVCHTCDTPSCVNPDHLFLGTRKDNMQDAAKKRRTTFGQRNAQSKLTEEQAKAILNAVGLQREVAVQYGIQQNTVSRIKSGARWGHLNAK